MSIFTEIGIWVKGWRLDLAFKKIFKKDGLKEVCAKAVILLQSLREKLADPTIKDITDAIPGNWDEATVAKTKEILPKVLTAMSEGSECVQKTDNLQIALCVYQKIKSHTDDTVRANGWNGFAVAIAAALSDGKFDITDILSVVPAAWQALFGKKA